MLASLWGLAVLWAWPGRPGNLTVKTGAVAALASGAAAGSAILVRPSWAFFVPVVLLLWVIAERRDRGARLRRRSRGRDLLARARGGDESVVGSQCRDLWPVRTDGALDGGQPL